MDDIFTKIGEFRDLENRNEPVQEADETVEIVDLYADRSRKKREYQKKNFPRGASTRVLSAVQSVVVDGLAHAYKRAKDDSESLKESGERERANIVKQQYMDEWLLPAIELVVNTNSPDELLNSKRALSMLDKYVLIEGSGDGYTSAYVRTAYANQLGQQSTNSDPYVSSQVKRLNSLLDNGQIRTAYGLASKLKKQLDDGAHIADDIDYDLIGRVVAYFS